MKKLLLILGLMLAYFTSDAQYRMHTVQEIAEARAGTRDIRFNTYLHKNLGVSQSLAGLQLDSLYLGFGIDQLGNGVLDSTWWTQAESFSRTNNLDSTIIRRGVVAIQVDTINGASTKLDTAFVMRTNYNRGLAIMHRDIFDVAPTEVIYMGNIQSPNLDSTTTLIYHNNISGNELFGITMTDSASIYTKSITLQEGNGIVIQAGDNESIVLRTYNDMLFRIDSTSLTNPNEVNIAEGPGFRDTFFLVSYGSGNVETAVYKSIDTLRAYLGENGFGTIYTGNSPINVTGSVISHDVSGVIADTYGTSVDIPVITVDAEGHITDITIETVDFPASTVGALNGTYIDGTDVNLGGYLDESTTISGQNGSSNYPLALDSLTTFDILVQTPASTRLNSLSMSESTGVITLRNETISTGRETELIMNTSGSILHSGVSPNDIQVSVISDGNDGTGYFEVDLNNTTTANNRRLVVAPSGFAMENVDSSSITGLQSLYLNTSTNEILRGVSNFIDLKSYAYFFEDFFGSDDGQTQLTWGSSGSGGNNAIVSSELADNHPGIALQTSSGIGSANPIASLSAPDIYAKEGLEFEALVNINGFTASNNFFIGLVGSSGGLDRIGFFWDGSGNIELEHSKNGTSVLENTGVAESDGSWVAVKFIVGATTISYYINGTLSGNTALDGTVTPSGASFPNATTGDFMVPWFESNMTISSAFEPWIDCVSLKFPVTR